MFKKFLAGCGAGLMIFPTISAFAETQQAPTKTEAIDESEASIANLLIAQILDSVEKASSEAQFTGKISDVSGLVFSNLKVNATVSFKADWKVDLGAKKKGQLNQVLPVILMDSKDLVTSFEYDQNPDHTSVSLHFYGLDQKKDKWIDRPLTVTVNNRLNKSLTAIKFYDIKANITHPKNANGPSQIAGTCTSQKRLWDFSVRRYNTVTVDCEFKGTYSRQTKAYDIDFKYVNAKPTVGFKP